MKTGLFRISAIGLLLILGLPFSGSAGATAVRFAQSASRVECYDFIEITVHVSDPSAGNPFTEAQVTGRFVYEDNPIAAVEGQAPNYTVDGFCDAADGILFRVRFMPSKPGKYAYTVAFKRGNLEATHDGTFKAYAGKRRGLIRVDREHPFHFVWAGTGEHFFWNSTTAYALIGWRDEAVIRQSIDRLAKLKVNRVRAAIIPPRVRSGQQWFEPMVTNNAAFDFRVNVWTAARSDSYDDPGFDTSRFNVAHFQKYERLLRHARERGVVVSVIFYVDGRLPGVDPFRKERMGGEDEQRYYRYAVARFAAFANVMWDVTNEYRLFRDDAWTEKMGALIKRHDVYDHLMSVHGHDTFNFRKSPWADFAMYQSWDEHGGYNYMSKNRREQEKTGRPMPQVNEEYGYEDHYPQGWGGGRKWPARTADNRRRLAWEMTMAGCYQSTGERADEPGYGGWINGRGNHAMTMLQGYARMREFFERIPWWQLEPRPDLVDEGALCLAESGRRYVLYLPKSGRATVKLEAGHYHARWYNPRTGKFTKLPDVTGGEWKSPAAPDAEDWVLLVEAR